MRAYRTVALIAVFLALGVVILGAYVRLSHAGLGCPDWPVCYGKITWPAAPEDIAHANTQFPERPVEVHKAWKEQVHRFFAAALGVLVLYLALKANWWARARRMLVASSAIAAAAGVFVYIAGFVWLSVLASAYAVGSMLWGSWRWKDDTTGRVSAFLLALIIVQAMLGMWTVTLQLKPIIVTGHLLGGMATLGLLWWIFLRTNTHQTLNPKPDRWPITLALLVLIAQIFLGGWVSTNYAALSCPDLPTCGGQWWPQADFKEAFVLWRGIGVDYEGGVLDHYARVAIQQTHRIGAVVLTTIFLWVIVRLWRSKRVLGASLLLGALLLQVTLGVLNVVEGLPLLVASAHNGGAALLLLVLLWLRNRETNKAPW